MTGGKIVNKNMLNYLEMSKCHARFTRGTIPFPTFYHILFPPFTTIIVLPDMTSLKKPLCRYL